jgi:hypothetical protein
MAQPSSLLEEAQDWWFKLRVLLQRNVQVYARNPSNALGRFGAYQGMALLSSIFLCRIGFVRGLLRLHLVIGKEGGLLGPGAARNDCTSTFIGRHVL